MRLPYQDDLGALRLVHRVLTMWACLALLDNVSHAPACTTGGNCRSIGYDEPFVCLPKHAHIPTHPDGLLFTDDDGEALRRTAFSREVWRPTNTKIPDVPAATGMHDLRHYYASLLIRHGESEKTVQRRLGHATAAETPRHLLAPVARLR